MSGRSADMGTLEGFPCPPAMEPVGRSPSGSHATEFLDRLRAGPPLVLDGGLGTMLQSAGLERGTAPDAWNLAKPDAVVAVHRAYVLAGSEAVHTNSFGANPIRLGRFGLADRTVEVNAAAVRLARAAAPAFVIGDVGPSGEYLPPVGQADPARLRAAFAAQAQALAAAAVDALHVETMSDLREARLALEALREAAPGVPVMVSLTFERKRRGFFTVMGDHLAVVLADLARAGADAVGANCSIASPAMRELALEALATATVPVVLQPNAGTPDLMGGAVVYRQSPEEFAEDVAAMAKAGARAVGGCCGTDPRFIAALRARLGGAPAGGDEAAGGGAPAGGEAVS